MVKPRRRLGGGDLRGEWGESENNRRARYYALTAQGGRRLIAETEKWNRMAGIIGDILLLSPSEVQQ